MENCFKCGRSDAEVRLFDGVHVNEEVKTCEKCALIECIPVVRLPNIDQLRGSEKGDVVRQRMKHISGQTAASQPKSLLEELNEIDKRQMQEKTEEAPMRLADNFHWILQRERRKKGLTQAQLSSMLGESEMALHLIEQGKLPDGAVSFIKKLEQFFMMKLIKKTANELAMEEQQKKRRFFRAESIAQRKPAERIRMEIAKEQPKILSFRREKSRDFTVADLREIHKKIEQDFSVKSREEIGREQLEDFGKTPETTAPKLSPDSWSKNFLEKRKERIGTKRKPAFFGMAAGDVPSISELAELKEAKEAKFGEAKDNGKMLGDDIEIIGDDKEQDL